MGIDDVTSVRASAPLNVTAGVFVEVCPESSSFNERICNKDLITTAFD